MKCEWVVLLACVSAFIAAGCDTAVDPIQESTFYFSFGGVIDASVDTQFVRVNPLRRTAAVNPEPLDAVVMTTEISTGRTAIWKDSVFTIGTDRRPVHNFWSDFPFQTGETYRFSARDSDGRESVAMVTIPDTFRMAVRPEDLGRVGGVSVYDVAALADVRVMFCARERGVGPLQSHQVSILNRMSRFSEGLTTVIHPFQMANELRLTDVEWIRVLAIVAGPEWPPFERYDPESLALPHLFSNVENGLGYLGGVTSKILDWTRDPDIPECSELLQRW